MASAIGLRVYQVRITKKGDIGVVGPTDADLNLTFNQFLQTFVSSHDQPSQNAEANRSWYIDDRTPDDLSGHRGYVSYGTLGFESDFVDSKTKKKKYHRQTQDVEEIPLYFEFWCPPDSEHALMAFQSFQARSCVGLVMGRLRECFELYNPGYVLRFRKLLPTNSSAGLWADTPVKNLRLIKHNAHSDIANRYVGDGASGAIDVEMQFRAKRKGALGSLSNIAKSLKGGTGVFAYDDFDFDEAIADVRIGKRTRPVHLFGPSGDAGVIDLTEQVTFGSDGHPTFDSIKAEVDEILKDFHAYLMQET